MPYQKMGKSPWRRDSQDRATETTPGRLGQHVSKQPKEGAREVNWKEETTPLEKTLRRSDLPKKKFH